MNEIESELRRGLIQLLVLALAREEAYGYDLTRRLEEKGFPVEEGSLYPLLRRLEERGYLQSAWNTEGARPRKYYSTTESGRQTLAQMKESWAHYNRVVDSVLEEMLQ